MASSQSGTFSTATPHDNPFKQSLADDKVFISSEPLGAPSAATVEPTDPTLPAASSSSATPASASSANPGQTAADIAARAQASIQNTKEYLQSTETKPNLAGNLAPDNSPLAPETVPAGTEHVTSLISNIGGAIASAPAAALEALSPVAASKVSDAAAAVNARLPALSLADAQATASGLANKAYSAVPEGTAATVQSYVGAAVHKAQEVLPPALGGTTTTGNTGSGDLAKPPTQLASEYGTAAQQQAQGVAGQDANVISSYTSAAAEKIAALTGAAQQKAGEAATAASQTASNAAAQAQQTASNAATSAQQTASNVAGATRQTANDAANSASQTASNVTEATRQTANDAAQATRQTAADASQKTSEYASLAQDKASDASQATRETANTYSTAAQEKAQQAAYASRETAQDAAFQGNQYASSTLPPGYTSTTGSSGLTGSSATTGTYGTTGTTGSTVGGQETAGPGGYSFSREEGMTISEDFPGSSSNQVDRVNPQ